MKRVLVIRGNGKVHKPLDRALLERGIAVRVLTRRAERARGAHPRWLDSGAPAQRLTGVGLLPERGRPVHRGDPDHHPFGHCLIREWRPA